MILLLDGFIKLAPWRTVTETMDRIGYAASESLARSISVAFAACTGLCPFPTASIFGSLLLTGYFAGVVPSMPSGELMLSHVLFGFYVGMALWAGLWWRGRGVRIDTAA